MQRSNTIDFAQAVLRKYPDAYAGEYCNEWQIYATAQTGRTIALCGLNRDRDKAWESAYRRIYKTTPTSEAGGK